MITQKPLEGVLWKLLALGCFATINGVVRYLSCGDVGVRHVVLPVVVIVFFQNILALFFIAPWVVVKNRLIFTSNNVVLHALRVFFAVLGICLWYLGLQHIQIATSVALGFMGPVVTIIGAAIFLHEHLSKPRILATLISFIGAVFIVRPDKILLGVEDYNLAILLPICATVSFACSKLLTRKLAANGASAKLLTIYLLIFMVPVSLIPALYQWQTPSTEHLPYLLSLGILSAVAHLAFNRAYALAEVTFLMPFGFAKIIFSALVGYFWFNELPEHYGIYIGMVIIFASTLFLGHFDKTVARAS